jgi:transposase
LLSELSKFRKDLLFANAHIVVLKNEASLANFVINELTVKAVFSDAKLLELTEENKILRLQVGDSKHKATSSNSSLPPSMDLVKKTQSLREKSNMKSGGQPGYKGHTLEITSKPDEAVKHFAEFFNKCGNSLTEKPRYLGKRMTVEIPPIKPWIVAHEQYERRCNCGHCTVKPYPDHVKASLSYGPSVEAMCSYMKVRQYVPLDRLKEIFCDVFGMDLSQATILTKCRLFAAKCEPIYDIIKERIQKSSVVGSDETGCNINGKNHWMWVWQNERMTYIKTSANRGSATIDATFPKGFPNVILVHDCWKAHFQTIAKSHQICLAHLLREMQYFIERRSDKWAWYFKKLLKQAIKIRRQIDQNLLSNTVVMVRQIKEELLKLLSLINEIKVLKLKTFAKRMMNYKDYIFQFLDNCNVPFDNNGSERAFRNVKLKIKISGLFRTFRGAQEYAVVRSVMDTTLKNGGNIFDFLKLIQLIEPE